MGIHSLDEEQRNGSAPQSPVTPRQYNPNHSHNDSFSPRGYNDSMRSPGYFSPHPQTPHRSPSYYNSEVAPPAYSNPYTSPQYTSPHYAGHAQSPRTNMTSPQYQSAQPLHPPHNYQTFSPTQDQHQPQPTSQPSQFSQHAGQLQGQHQGGAQQKPLHVMVADPYRQAPATPHTPGSVHSNPGTPQPSSQPATPASFRQAAGHYPAQNGDYNSQVAPA